MLIMFILTLSLSISKVAGIFFFVVLHLISGILLFTYFLPI